MDDHNAVGVVVEDQLRAADRRDRRGGVHDADTSRLSKRDRIDPVVEANRPANVRLAHDREGHLAEVAPSTGRAAKAITAAREEVNTVVTTDGEPRVAVAPSDPQRGQKVSDRRAWLGRRDPVRDTVREGRVGRPVQSLGAGSVQRGDERGPAHCPSVTHPVASPGPAGSCRDHRWRGPDRPAHTARMGARTGHLRKILEGVLTGPPAHPTPILESTEQGDLWTREVREARPDDDRCVRELDAKTQTRRLLGRDDQSGYETSQRIRVAQPPCPRQPPSASRRTAVRHSSKRACPGWFRRTATARSPSRTAPNTGGSPPDGSTTRSARTADDPTALPDRARFDVVAHAVLARPVYPVARNQLALRTVRRRSLTPCPLTPRR